MFRGGVGKRRVVWREPLGPDGFRSNARPKERAGGEIRVASIRMLPFPNSAIPSTAITSYQLHASSRQFQCHHPLAAPPRPIATVIAPVRCGNENAPVRAGKTSTYKSVQNSTERVGFEPTDPSSESHDFQSCSLSHSDISPKTGR
jgi:hypothetical protein